MTCRIACCNFGIDKVNKKKNYDTNVLKGCCAANQDNDEKCSYSAASATDTGSKEMKVSKFRNKEERDHVVGQLFIGTFTIPLHSVDSEKETQSGSKELSFRHLTLVRQKKNVVTWLFRHQLQRTQSIRIPETTRLWSMKLRPKQNDQI